MLRKKAGVESRNINIDGNRIVREIIAEDRERKKLSFYLDKQLYEDFKHACGDAVIGKVVERLMQAFIESRRSTGTRNRRKV